VKPATERRVLAQAKRAQDALGELLDGDLLLTAIARDSETSRADGWPASATGGGGSHSGGSHSDRTYTQAVTPHRPDPVSSAVEEVRRRVATASKNLVVAAAISAALASHRVTAADKD